MNILVIGASGGSGRAVTHRLLDLGHTVTALARRTAALGAQLGLTVVSGDATDAATLDRVLPGHDAVVVTLGISEPTLRVRLRGARETANDVRSRATRLIVAAAERAGISRVVVQSSYGVGPTARLLNFVDRLFFALLIKPQIEDTELQERHVRASRLDWTIVQPVFLTDAESSEHFTSIDGRTRRRSVSRQGVAHAIADLVERAAGVRETVSVSG